MPIDSGPDNPSISPPNPRAADKTDCVTAAYRNIQRFCLRKSSSTTQVSLSFGRLTLAGESITPAALEVDLMDSTRQAGGVYDNVGT